MTRRAILSAAGISAFAAGLTTAGAQAASAEVLPPDAYPLRLPDMPLRDPYVLADPASGHHYLYVQNDVKLSGTPGIGTMVYRSRNLRDWPTPQTVFQVTPDLWGQRGAWAPEVHRGKGRWYLFVTLHDPNQPLPVPPAGKYGIPVQIPQFKRGTVIASSVSPLGPFAVIDPSRSVAPTTFMTLDGTLFKDDKGKPWMVYAHEWIQKLDGTIEALPLKDDLSGAAGRPIHLFKGSDATWISEDMPTPSVHQLAPYVTDGPQLHRLPGGALGMLWSTYGKTTNSTNGTVTGPYVQTWAVSPSGRLKGPWLQGRPLVRGGGHGMVFDSLPRGKKQRRVPMLIVHKGGTRTVAKLYEIELRRDGYRLGKQRKDLDGTA